MDSFHSKTSTKFTPLTLQNAKSRGISDVPAFKWWVNYTIKKRNVLVSAMKARLRRVSYKYGIEVPTTKAHALELDKANGNDFWSKAIAKEMMLVSLSQF